MKTISSFMHNASINFFSKYFFVQHVRPFYNINKAGMNILLMG